MKYVNPVDTHDWENQLDKDGKWNLNSICRRCKCELMPAFRGISEEGTSPCPGFSGTTDDVVLSAYGEYTPITVRGSTVTNGERDNG